LNRERNAEFGRAGRIAGKEGERFAGTILHKAVLVDMPGADFMIPGRRPQYVEVKATFSQRPDKAVVLKTRGGKWVNALADHVVIVTNTHVYFADAEALRRHVREHFDSFSKLPSRKHETIVRVNVPVAHLEEHGVARGVERKRTKKIAELVRKIASKTLVPPYREGAPIAGMGQKPPKHLVFARRPFYNRRIPPGR